MIRAGFIRRWTASPPTRNRGTKWIPRFQNTRTIRRDKTGDRDKKFFSSSATIRRKINSLPGRRNNCPKLNRSFVAISKSETKKSEHKNKERSIHAAFPRTGLGPRFVHRPAKRGHGQSNGLVRAIKRARQNQRRATAQRAGPGDLWHGRPARRRRAVHGNQRSSGRLSRAPSRDLERSGRSRALDTDAALRRQR